MLNFKQVVGLGLTDYGQHHLGQVHDQGDLENLRDRPLGRKLPWSWSGSEFTVSSRVDTFVGFYIY